MDEWRGTWDMDGGALMNQASHYVDLLHWLIGPVSRISASINTLGRDIEVEDTAAIQIKWEGRNFRYNGSYNADIPKKS